MNYLISIDFELMVLSFFYFRNGIFNFLNTHTKAIKLYISCEWNFLNDFMIDFL